jgi:ABC-type uncharacterized transport system permease subunit
MSLESNFYMLVVFILLAFLLYQVVKGFKNNEESFSASNMKQSFSVFMVLATLLMLLIFLVIKLG